VLAERCVKRGLAEPGGGSEQTLAAKSFEDPTVVVTLCANLQLRPRHGLTGTAGFCSALDSIAAG
jgi:hypothetical protein